MALERIIPGTHAWKMWGHQHLQRYLFTERFVFGKRVLDLACGAGYGSHVLRTLGATTVVGVDLDAEAIAYAGEKYKRSGLRYEQGDALRWQSKSRFDVVISFETIEHLPAPEQFLKRVAGHLQPDGTFIVSAPNTLQYLKANPPVKNEHHINEPDYAMLRKWLEAEFIIDAEWEQSPVAPQTSRLFLNDLAVTNLLRQGWVRISNRLEHCLRRIVGRPQPPIQGNELDVKAMECFTEIMPLLPERTADCNVMIFVCRRRP